MLKVHRAPRPAYDMAQIAMQQLIRRPAQPPAVRLPTEAAPAASRNRRHHASSGHRWALVVSALRLALVPRAQDAEACTLPRSPTHCEHELTTPPPRLNRARASSWSPQPLVACTLSCAGPATHSCRGNSATDDEEPNQADDANHSQAAASSPHSPAGSALVSTAHPRSRHAGQGMPQRQQQQAVRTRRDCSPGAQPCCSAHSCAPVSVAGVREQGHCRADLLVVLQIRCALASCSSWTLVWLLSRALLLPEVRPAALSGRALQRSTWQQGRLTFCGLSGRRQSSGAACTCACPACSAGAISRLLCHWRLSDCSSRCGRLLLRLLSVQPLTTACGAPGAAFAAQHSLSCCTAAGANRLQMQPTPALHTPAQTQGQLALDCCRPGLHGQTGSRQAPADPAPAAVQATRHHDADGASADVADSPSSVQQMANFSQDPHSSRDCPAAHAQRSSQAPQPAAVAAWQQPARPSAARAAVPPLPATSAAQAEHRPAVRQFSHSASRQQASHLGRLSPPARASGSAAGHATHARPAAEAPPVTTAQLPAFKPLPQLRVRLGDLVFQALAPRTQQLHQSAVLPAQPAAQPDAAASSAQQPACGLTPEAATHLATPGAAAGAGRADEQQEESSIDASPFRQLLDTFFPEPLPPALQQVNIWHASSDQVGANQTRLALGAVPLHQFTTAALDAAVD